jgi:hypothetical protein
LSRIRPCDLTDVDAVAAAGGRGRTPTTGLAELRAHWLGDLERNVLTAVLITDMAAVVRDVHATRST